MRYTKIIFCLMNDDVWFFKETDSRGKKKTSVENGG